MCVCVCVCVCSWLLPAAQYVCMFQFTALSHGREIMIFPHICVTVNKVGCLVHLGYDSVDWIQLA
jgi:hypothetical protein